MAGERWVASPSGPPQTLGRSGEVKELDTPAALSWRASQASQRDIVAGMFFNSTLGEIARKVGPAAASRASHLALGMAERDFEHFYRYPVADLLRLMDVGARMVGGDYATSLTDFGRAAMQAFLDSPMGRTLLMLGGREPHRLLLTLASGNHGPASFGSRIYERTEERAAVICYTSELLGPNWLTGAIEQAFRRVFSLHPVISVSPGTAVGTFSLQIRW
ncbi:MAG TPA: DUF2378 family protein [Myxococcaceae bacterium]|nr:DUF2378 family protein [Myxococcaceae bacterium]